MIWILVIVLGLVCCKFFYEGGRIMMREEMRKKLENYTFIKKIKIKI
ncbi:MAG TPA: hypothetical protein VMZ91_05225 [Candidatus Paceibacterota bacterium]|nr:hypothetical protein [Candidatus Paceibacterota bacterium]